MKKFLKILSIVIVFACICTVVVFSINDNAAKGVEAWYNSIITNIKQKDDTNALKGEEAIYNALYEELEKVSAKKNKESVIAVVDGEKIYKSDALIGLANNNFAVTLNAEDITDTEEKSTYIEKYTINEQQAKEYLVALVICRNRIDKEIYDNICKETDDMLDEQIELTKKTVPYNYYNEFLKATGFSEEKYREHIRNNIINTACFNYEFEKLYKAENYKPEELNELKNSFASSVVKEKGIKIS